MKGISREVVPYTVDNVRDVSAIHSDVVVEHLEGLDFYLDPALVAGTQVERVRSLLVGALAALDRRKGMSAPGPA